VVGDDYVVTKSLGGALARFALATPALPVTLGSMLLALLAILSIPELWRWLRSGWHRRVPAIGWIAVAWLSFIGFRGGSSGVKELLQVAEFAGLVVLAGLLCRNRKTRETVLLTAVAGAGLMAASALIEYADILASSSQQAWLGIGSVDGLLGWDWQAARPGERGSEGSRNALAYYCALTLPLLVVYALGHRAMWKRLMAIVVAVGLLFCCMHLGLLIIGVGAAIVAAGMMGGRRWQLLALGAIAALSCMIVAVPPHGHILADSAAVYRYTDVYGLHPQPLRGAGMDDPDIGDWSPWQQKAVERQAVLNGMLQHPISGHGLGRYQTVINGYYSDGPVAHLWVPKPAVNLMERDAHSIWLVLALEGGVLLPMLLIAVILLAVFSAMSSVSIRRERAALWLGLAIVLITGGASSSFAVRGLFGVVALLVALAATARRERDAHSDRQRVR
jgi:hypothetical protein